MRSVGGGQRRAVKEGREKKSERYGGTWSLVPKVQDEKKVLLAPWKPWTTTHKQPEERPQDTHSVRLREVSRPK